MKLTAGRRPKMLVGPMRSTLLVAVVVAAAGPGWAWASHTDEGHGRSRRGAVVAPPIPMQHTSTRETFWLRPDSARQRGLRHFLRCHHTGREHAIAPRLGQLLYAVARHFGNRPIDVVAGYRAPRVARAKGNPRSPHRQGLACDFRIEGVDTATLRDYLRSAFHGVGVGYYPNSGFVHLDVGRRRDAFWIDYSGPGERARYSRDPEGDLRSGVQDRDESDGDPGAADALDESSAADVGAAPATAGADVERGRARPAGLARAVLPLDEP
jgi:uncharacterized protein YcbK (DUF882 family)